MVVMGTTYSYKVASENEIGWGPNSSAVLVALPPVPPPGKPSDLHVSVDEGQVTLTWSHPSQSGAAAITGYKVYRGTTPGLLTLVATVDGTTFVDTDVKENPRYYYQVSAVSSAGEGPATGEVVAVIIASIPSYLWMVIIGAVGAIVAIGAVLIYLRK
jgi:fibronectin type 3 domain-containing protein